MDNVIAFLLVVALLIYVFRHPSRTRGSWKHAGKTSSERSSQVDYAAVQLDTVMKSTYAPKRLMNSGEYKVFATIERYLKSSGTGKRVFSQVSMGEILTAQGAAYDAINSKRVDLLVISPFGMPEVVIEHQGEGHHAGNAAARDAVKREALRRAGITMVETYDSDSEETILQKAFPLRDARPAIR